MIFRNVSEGLFSCPNNFRNEIAGCDVTFETFITPNKAHRVDRKVGPVRSISILINSMPDPDGGGRKTVKLKSFLKLIVAVGLFVALVHVVVQVPAGIKRIEARAVRK